MKNKQTIKMEVFVELGDKYIGFEVYKITSQFEQYHCDMVCYPISVRFNVIHPYRNFSIDLGLFGIFISMGVGRLGK